jgi:hypothetical protein
MAASEFALFETTAKSRAAAKETLTAANSEAPMIFRKNTLAPPKHKSPRGDSQGFWSLAQRNQGHVPSGAKSSGGLPTYGELKEGKGDRTSSVEGIGNFCEIR